ncbi:MAG TPA: hypothetical protein VI796_03925 [Candidatus Thermoplasmatota archaeon]|nr:hypothetical protein [Candidatus Thermoplasmatota archaeon]
MAKALAEQRSVVARGESAPWTIEPVFDGGNIRRIVFEGDPNARVEFTERRPAAPMAFAAPMTETVTLRRETYHPAHSHDAISTIEGTIDRLRREGGGMQSLTSTTIYETPTGAVRAATVQEGGRRRRSFFLSRRKGGVEEERRFSELQVDRAIAAARPGESELASEYTIVQADPNAPPLEVKPLQSKAARRSHGLLGIFRRKRKAKAEPEAPAEEPATEAEGKEYQPQCAAITDDGMQCRNSTKHRSKYCASHQGYRPPTMAKVIASKDTLPTNVIAEDTKPGEGAAWDPETESEPQCGAYTKGGQQCRNSAKHGSKYCASHKGYKPPTEKGLLRSLDTRPRWSKAKDTKPTVKGPVRGKKKAKKGGR